MVKMGDVWDRTTEFLGNHMTTVLPVVLAGIFVPMSIANGLSELWPISPPSGRIALTIAFVGIYLAVFWAYLTLTALTIDPLSGGRAAHVALRRLLPGIGIYIVLGLIVGALTAPFGVLLAMSGIDMEAMQRGEQVAAPAAGYGWALLIYLILFVVLLLAGSARLATLGGVVVAERRGARAPVRAVRMTRGLTWKLIGVALLYFVVSQIAQLAARTVFGTILRIFAGGEGALSVATVVTGVVVAAVGAAFLTLAAVFCARLYVAIAAREGPASGMGVPAQP